MHKLIVLPLLYMIISLTCSGQSSGAPTDSLLTKTFSARELREDFAYMRRALQETHPGLYRYTSREVMDREMDSLYGLLKDSMNVYTYYGLLTYLVADIRCAHTSLVPQADWEKAFSTNYRIFPYQLYIADNRTYVVLNRTTDTLVKLGYELLTINGVAIDSLRRRIFRHSWADGYNETSKMQRCNGEMFNILYYWLIGRPDSFVVTVKNERGELLTVSSPALPFAQGTKNTMTNPLNQALLRIYTARNQLDQKKRWRLETYKDRNAAVLIIRSFGGGKDEEDARKKMHDFMAASMKEIDRLHLSNLIIDLRFNGGGWDIQGEELFTWLSHAPALYYRRMHTITDSSEFLRFSDVPAEELKNVKKELVKEADGTFSLKEEYTKTLAIQRPQPNAFKGKVYFLINGASGSTTSEFTAAAHANHLGVFIGEETGGNYSGGNGGSFIGLVLPHTGLKLTIPLQYYDNAVNRPYAEGRGTFPDYAVPDRIEDVLVGKVTQLDHAFALIGKGK